jgi:hypothetical protein
MGLWDLKSQNDDLLRIATPLVDEYQQLVASGSERVGKVGRAVLSAPLSVKNADSNPYGSSVQSDSEVGGRASSRAAEGHQSALTHDDPHQQLLTQES